jgi:hypothetical protein
MIYKRSTAKPALLAHHLSEMSSTAGMRKLPHEPKIESAVNHDAILTNQFLAESQGG